MARWGAFALISVIATVAAIGFQFPSQPMPRFAILNPIAYFVAVLGDAATTIVLISVWHHSSTRRATLVLALSFAVSAVFAFLAMLSLQLLPQGLPVIASPPATGRWMYVFWRVAAALGAFAYVLARRGDSPAPPSRRFVLTAVASTVVLSSAATAAFFILGSRLPSLGTTDSVSGLVVSGIGPFVAALLAAATVTVLALPRPRGIDRALACSLLALTLDLLIVMAGEQLYTMTFYAARLLLLFGALFVLSSAVRSLVGARIRLRDMQSALVHAEDESAKRAGRIRAMWQMASEPPRIGDRLGGSLDIASRALRPSRPMFGSISHLEGDTIVIDATSWNAEDHAASALAETVHRGSQFPLDRTLHGRLRDAGHTVAVDDLESEGPRDASSPYANMRSFIGSPMTIGGRPHFVVFYSPDSMRDQPFAADDVAFVDVVAAFFAARFTQQVQFEQIQFQIEHDALTGLENRIQFRKAVREEILAGRPFVAAFIDLDGFRFVNERDGHETGDEVLVEVAAELAGAVPGARVARMSGDEFGVLVPGAGSVDDATRALKPYADLFLEPFKTGDRLGPNFLGVGATIGAARFPADGDSAEDLMRRADVALAVAKTRGGSTMLLFDAAMEEILEDARVRVGELVDAIERDQLALVYQPTFDLADRHVTGGEALVRWDHPTRGRLSPAEFIAVAERNGLIGPLSRWVLRRLLHDLRGAGELPPGFRIYFNLAAMLLDDVPFIAEMNELLRSMPELIPHLGVEVTETAAMQNVERSMYTIDLFRRWGLFVAIDDFGTGYSSLSYLKQLTVDVIKIDRSFVQGLPEDNRDGALTEMLLRITDTFGFATLAEGIETEAQAAWLLEHGCRYGQGYLLARPGSFAELLNGIHSPRPQPAFSHQVTS